MQALALKEIKQVWLLKLKVAINGDMRLGRYWALNEVLKHDVVREMQCVTCIYMICMTY